MYHIIKQSVCFLQEKTIHKYLIVSDRVDDGEKGRLGGWLLLSLFAVSVLPSSFNSPNDMSSNPAGLVLALDQAVFERIKGKTAAGKQSSKPPWQGVKRHFVFAGLILRIVEAFYTTGLSIRTQTEGGNEEG